MKKLTILILSVFLLLTSNGFSQTPHPLPLYPEGSAESNGLSAAGVTLTPEHLGMAVDADYFLFPADPEQATGQAVVICPGGGYAGVAYAHEGLDVAKWLNTQGITALVLRYRMPNGHPSIPLKDAQTALKLMRQNARIWHIDTLQVGIMGFSAGGHLAATASTCFTGNNTRPDFSILIYPVISMETQTTHMGSRVNLLGEDAPNDLTERYCAQKQVSEQTPPAFLALCDDDSAVPPGHSIAYYSALKAHSIPSELHIYRNGGHGWGWRESFEYHNELLASLEHWLREIRK